MSSVTKLDTGTSIGNKEWQMRVDLAAAFRLAVYHDWHESIANHFSLAVSDDGKKFLMNPRWRHFSTICASDLMLLDAEDDTIMNRPDAPDETAWCIHGRIHKHVPHARCLLHVHPAYSTALASLADPVVKPIDQNTARFYNRVAYDLNFSGMANSIEEGDRLAEALADKKIMMMGNHGVLVTGSTVAEAYDALYHLERACRNLVLAYSTGQPLSVMSDNLAEHTAQDWEAYKGADLAHFEEMKRLLDKQDASYAS